jgi:site-specific recombinase XerD
MTNKELANKFFFYIDCVRHLSKLTINVYKHDIELLIIFIKETKLTEITSNVILDFIISRSNKIGQNSIARTLSCFKTFFHYLVIFSWE